MSGVSRLVAERNHRLLLELVAQPGNDVCADCKSKAPRWASHNLGIFICVRCASIHRKIGTHVTKVKSLTLDQWSKEQVENMKNIGNVKANKYWNPDELRHPPPANMEESERDSEIEKYVRAKYEFKRYRTPPMQAAEHLGPSRSGSSLPARSRTAPIRSDTVLESPPVLPSPSAVFQPQAHTSINTMSSSLRVPPQVRSASADLSKAYSVTSPLSTPTINSSSSYPSGISPENQAFTPSVRSSSTSPYPPAPSIPPNQQASLTSSVYNDLISLQTPFVNSSLPLQYKATSTVTSPIQTSYISSPTTDTPISLGKSSNSYSNLSVNPTSGFPQSMDSSMSFRSASLPVSSHNGTDVDSMAFGVSSSSTNPFYQQFGTRTAAISSSAPFADSLMPLASGSQASIMTTSTSHPPPTDMMLQAQASPFRQIPSPFTVSPGGYQPGSPRSMMQPPGAFSTESPFSQQAQQAQQLFQNMAGGRNPFGSQY